MTLTWRVLAGLVAGFALGLALAGSESRLSTSLVAVLATLGTLFVNLIRMTVIPLIASMLVAGIGRQRAWRGLGRLGLRGLVIALVLLAVSAAASVAIAVPVLSLVHIDAAAARALRGSLQSTTAAAASSHAPTLAGWLADLIPANVFKAATDGATLPVIVFAVLFGAALTRVDASRRDAVLRVADGTADAMQQLVTWILQLAPVGVFALAVPLAARLGLAAAGAVLAYIALVVTLTVAAIGLVLYPLGMLTTRLGLAAFAAYCAPAQAIAFASRSSLAALPAMIASAERAGLAPSASRVVLPFAMAIFHYGAAVAQAVGAIFLARLFDVTLTPAHLASIVMAVVVASFAAPGIPGGSIIAMVPVLSAAGLPLEGIGILLAVDTIPDMFRTTANVTGAMTLAAMLPIGGSAETAQS